MTRELIAFIALLIVPTVALIAYISVKRRRRRQELQIGSLAALQPGEPLPECLYVSTVYADSPLVRVWARGLGPRGKARPSVSESGLAVERTGEEGFTIEAASLQKISTSTATIDKGVEADGLVSIHWVHSDVQLITQLRFSSKESHQLAIDTITTTLGVRFE